MLFAFILAIKIDNLNLQVTITLWTTTHLRNGAMAQGKYHCHSRTFNQDNTV